MAELTGNTNIETKKVSTPSKVSDTPKADTKMMGEEKQSYTAMPFKDYIEHTATIEGGDPEFKSLFPKEKEEQLNKREEEFRSKYGQYAANRSWYGDVFNKQIGSERNRLGDVVLSTAKQQGIDPKTLLGSFMEEGGYKFAYGEKEKYSGSILGLEDFHKDYDKIKQYLPKDFKDKFDVAKGDKREMVEFKDPKDAATALAGYLNYYKDQVKKIAKEKGIKLSPEAESFWTQAAYNSSKDLKPENVKKMMDYYKSKGLLKDDKFLKEDNLGKDKYGAIYENTRRRIDSINALEKENLIDLSEKRQQGALKGTWTKNIEGTMAKTSKGNLFSIRDKNIPFNVLILPNGNKKIIPKGANPETLDPSKLKDLDEYDLEANKS